MSGEYVFCIEAETGVVTSGKPFPALCAAGPGAAVSFSEAKLPVRTDKRFRKGHGSGIGAVPSVSGKYYASVPYRLLGHALAGDLRVVRRLPVRERLAGITVLSFSAQAENKVIPAVLFEIIGALRLIAPGSDVDRLDLLPALGILRYQMSKAAFFSPAREVVTNIW